MELFLVLSGWLAALAILLFLLDYFKNVRKFERLNERFFAAFLKLERSSENFAHQFMDYFFHEVKRVFFASASVFFTIQNDEIRMENRCGNYSRNLFQTDWKKGQTQVIPSRLKSSLTLAKLKQHLFRKKKYQLILPLVYHKKLVAFFVLVYRQPLSYYRARKLILLHSYKFRQLAFDIIRTMRDRQQDYTQAMLSSIKDYAFITLTEDLKIKSWNKGAELLFGYLSHDALDRKITSFLNNPSRKKLLGELSNIRNREEWKVRLIVEDCNQKEFITDAVMKPLKLDDLMIGYYLILKDVTQEEVWKDNLKKQSFLNKSIIDNTGDGILMLNAENRIIFCNDRMKGLFDNSYSYLGMLMEMVLPGEYKNNLVSQIEKIKQEGISNSHIELKIRDKDYLVRIYPIQDKEKWNGCILFFIDQTAMVAVREKISEMNRSLLEHLSAARILHQNLIPQNMPLLPGWQCASVYWPAQEIGGDFYYALPLKTPAGSELALLTADVSGHGLVASMLTVLVKDVFLEFADQYQKQKNYPLSEFLISLNRKLHHLESDSTRFITVFLILVNLETGHLRYSSAGHPRALIFQKQKTQPFGLENSPPLGIMEDFLYQEATTVLNRGERLILFTDGISDLYSHHDLSLEVFLEQNRKENSQLLQENIEKDISKMIKDMETHLRDDLTILIVDRE